MRRATIANLCAIAALPLLTGCEGGEADELAAEDVAGDADTGVDAEGGEAQQAPATTPTDRPTEPITMAGTAWDANDSNGAVYTTFIDPEGTYRDFRDGKVWQIGSWDRPGGNRICFKPDNPVEEDGSRLCWTVRQPGEDGVMVAIDEDGREVTVREVEYVPPEDSPDE